MTLILQSHRFNPCRARIPISKERSSVRLCLLICNGVLASLHEADGDRLADFHLWRLGPGHLGAIVCVGTRESRGPNYYHAKLARFRSLSHLTIEVRAL
jgi:hypothetical protein